MAAHPVDTPSLGRITAGSADVAAILSDDVTADAAFSRHMQQLFFAFVKEKAVPALGVSMVGGSEEVSHLATLENCDFWRTAEPPLVPNYGKMF